MTATVYVNDVKLDIVSGVTVKNSSSTLVSSATFSTPINILDDAEAHASVRIMSGDNTKFIGQIDSHTVSYSGKSLSIALTCSDNLSTLVTESRISFPSGTMAGDAIEDLLATTGVNTSLIALRSTFLPDSVCVFPVNSNRLDAIQKIVNAVGAVIFLRFDEVTAYAICDTWSNLLSEQEFTTEVSVSDSTHLILSFKLDPAPDSDGTSKASITFVGGSVGIYNQLNLLGLYKNMGISYPASLWRISDITIKIEPSGIITDATLTDPTVDLSDTTSAASATNQTITSLVKTQTKTVVESTLGRVGVIATVGTGTISVEYPTGETEIITDWTA
jgi:hypothetical protein